MKCLNNNFCKKGQGLTLNIIIIAILGFLVLGFLIFLSGDFFVGDDSSFQSITSESSSCGSFGGVCISPQRGCDKEIFGASCTQDKICCYDKEITLESTETEEEVVLDEDTENNNCDSMREEYGLREACVSHGNYLSFCESQNENLLPFCLNGDIMTRGSQLFCATDLVEDCNLNLDSEMIELIVDNKRTKKQNRETVEENRRILDSVENRFTQTTLQNGDVELSLIGSSFDIFLRGSNFTESADIYSVVMTFFVNWIEEESENDDFFDSYPDVIFMSAKQYQNDIDDTFEDLEKSAYVHLKPVPILFLSDREAIHFYRIYNDFLSTVDCFSKETSVPKLFRSACGDEIDFETSEARLQPKSRWKSASDLGGEFLPPAARTLFHELLHFIDFTSTELEDGIYLYSQGSLSLFHEGFAEFYSEEMFVSFGKILGIDFSEEEQHQMSRARGFEVHLERLEERYSEEHSSEEIKNSFLLTDHPFISAFLTSESIHGPYLEHEFSSYPSADSPKFIGDVYISSPDWVKDVFYSDRTTKFGKTAQPFLVRPPKNFVYLTGTYFFEFLKDERENTFSDSLNFLISSGTHFKDFNADAKSKGYLNFDDYVRDHFMAHEEDFDGFEFYREELDKVFESSFGLSFSELERDIKSKL